MTTGQGDLVSASQPPAPQAPLRWYALGRREVWFLLLALVVALLSFVWRMATAQSAPPELEHRHEILRGTLDVNSACAAELSVIPGVGSVTAAAIVAERERHGPFHSLADFQARVSRLRRTSLESFEPYLVFSGGDASPARLTAEPDK